MTGGLSQDARVLASAQRDLRLHKLARRTNFPGYNPADDKIGAEDLYGRQARNISVETKARADAEWAAMDANGQLPEGWTYSPATLVESGHG